MLKLSRKTLTTPRNPKIKMNDAKGHASNLLILSLATALVGAGILSWSLAQSSLFKERPRTASSLAIKNTVSESIMTNEPVQNPIKIKIPDIKTIQATNPDEVAKKPDAIDVIIEEPKEAKLPVATPTTEPTKSANKVAPDEIATQEQKPETPAKETIVAEKIILPGALQNNITTTEIAPPEVSQNEITALTPEADAEVAPSRASQNDVAAATPESTETIPIEADPIVTETTITSTSSPETPQTEAAHNAEAASTIEAALPEVLQNDIATTTPESDTTDIPESEITIATAETDTAETITPEIVQNEITPIKTEVEISATQVIPAETPLENTAATSETPPNTETPEQTDQATQASAESSDEGTQATERKKSGWIYVGLYENGKWASRGLELPADKLPDAGKVYKLVWETNVRLAPPGKRKANGDNLANNIDYLAINREIEVTSVKNSGRTGHIWLEIKY